MVIPIPNMRSIFRKKKVKVAEWSKNKRGEFYELFDLPIKIVFENGVTNHLAGYSRSDGIMIGKEFLH